MAAASGGTASIMDAISEALGDLKVGETERLKSFGFEVSAEEFKRRDFPAYPVNFRTFLEEQPESWPVPERGLRPRSPAK
ncbi:MAG: hypothetical protein ACLRZZ_28485 [Enterocloster sp.]